MDESFENLIKSKAQGAQTEAYFGMALFGAFILFFVYWGFKIPFLFIPAVVFVGIGYLIYKKFPGDFKGQDYWINTIKNNPDNIVWIKPITTKHTVGLIVTLYKEQKFQILTSDGLSVTLKCDKALDAQILLHGVQTHMSHAQLGYSHQVKNLYKKDAVLFLQNLQQLNLYTPITSYKN